MARISSPRWMIAALLFAASPLAAGPDWVEPPGVDAGSVPGSAQSITGSGSLSSIGGELTAVSTASAGADDFEDMYCFQIVDPANFRAVTFPDSTFTGSANFDTQLWLFDRNGFGLLANDNAGPKEQGSGLPAPAGIAPGVYCLAISGFDNDPQSDGGPIFNAETREEVTGPDGEGGQDPIVAWGPPGEAGQYVIALTGAAFIEVDDSVPTLSEWGMVALAGFLLAAGATIMRRQRVQTPTQ